MSIDWNSVVLIAPFVSLAALLIGIITLVLSITTRVRISKIFRSANVPDIERLLKLHTKTLEEFVQFKAESSLYMKSLDDRIKGKMRSAPTVRFNPFQGGEMGGNQSFSSVFADEEGNGLVMTSMHTRERTNVFAKPLKNWKSEYELSEEEQGVISKSQQNESKK